MSAIDPPALTYSRHGNVNLPGAVWTSLPAEAHTEVSPSLWAIEWITDSLSTEPCGSAASPPPPLHHLPRVSRLQRCERCRRPVVCLVLFSLSCLCKAGRAHVCVCVQRGRAKGAANLLPHSGTFLKVEAKRLATPGFTDLNPTTRLGLTLTAAEHASASTWKERRDRKKKNDTHAAAIEYFGSRLFHRIFHRLIELSDKTYVCIIKARSVAERGH